MKNPRYERYRRLMRQFHRNRPWHLDDGVYIPQMYPDARTLSWWDETGFVLNGRRVMLWWEHPRRKYADELHKLACEQVSPHPELTMLKNAEKCWKRVGRSRKKVVAYRTQGSSAEDREYFDSVASIEQRLQLEGIEYSVRPSITVRWYSWGIGVELCTPQEVRNAEEARALASIGKRLVKRQITLVELFDHATYDRTAWLSEAAARTDDANQARS